MSTIDTKRLRDLAEKATPGPWFAENYATDPYDRTVVYNTFHNGDTMDRDLVAEVAYGNAEFIAATDPQTVLALLDEIDRLRGAIREALDFEAALPAIATVPHKILTDALEARGGETSGLGE